MLFNYLILFEKHYTEREKSYIYWPTAPHVCNSHQLLAILASCSCIPQEAPGDRWSIWLPCTQMKEPDWIFGSASHLASPGWWGVLGSEPADRCLFLLSFFPSFSLSTCVSLSVPVWPSAFQIQKINKGISQCK